MTTNSCGGNCKCKDKQETKMVEAYRSEGEWVFPYDAFEVVRVEVLFHKVRPNAKVFEYANYNDSGMDMYSAVDMALQPGETYIIPTGISVAVPDGLELQVRPTSGNSSKTKLRVANAPGTVDAGYRGEVGIIVDNIGEEAIQIREGQKVAQGVLCPVMKAHMVEVAELPKSDRGKKGYGECSGGIYG